jgi:hypothetical protein
MRTPQRLDLGHRQARRRERAPVGHRDVEPRAWREPERDRIFGGGAASAHPGQRGVAHAARALLRHLGQRADGGRQALHDADVLLQLVDEHAAQHLGHADVQLALRLRLTRDVARLGAHVEDGRGQRHCRLAVDGGMVDLRVSPTRLPPPGPGASPSKT